MDGDKLPPQPGVFASGLLLPAPASGRDTRPRAGLHPAPPGTLQTLGRGWRAGDGPHATAPAGPPQPRKPWRAAAAQLPAGDHVQSCCVNRGTCVSGSSSLGPTPPVPPCPCRLASTNPLTHEGNTKFYSNREPPGRQVFTGREFWRNELFSQSQRVLYSF